MAQLDNAASITSAAEKGHDLDAPVDADQTALASTCSPVEEELRYLARKENVHDQRRRKKREWLRRRLDEASSCPKGSEAGKAEGR